MIRFQIAKWAAWAPAANTSQASLLNLAGLSNEAPSLSEMPAMLRRRAGRLGKTALHTAYQAAEQGTACPVIFASRYGDITQSVEQLQLLAQSGVVSPSAFSMSVHNAISALFSIARKDTASYTAIAAGEETIEAAFTEAIGLLADDDAASVLLVCYDEPLPAPHHVFTESPAFAHAFACRLVKADRGFSLSSHATTHPADDLPDGLAILHFLLSEQHSLRHTAGARTWLWQQDV
ncbi:beta-ketoacyl synthase chain length factor [Iodobacter sp. CM08]|uniref:beta-ketoacyl synthase chain length factor n=1 Tax=Iodobacter sp. CM08 TaxID=3085902 RepID=UPI002981998D|nr:beta-ketoacyl synthase chain length factor [Iodobacter sp. CM08]MDW5416431.1 beta-ketoacyl synthase chain length factor [Iodobacter sp. CM08]